MYCLLFISFIESSQIDLLKNSNRSFKEYMGKETNLWQYVQDSDLFTLQFFEDIFSHKLQGLASSDSNFSIPKVLHIIWIGPKPFPETSLSLIHI